jgi:hypothetical protein
MNEQNVQHDQTKQQANRGVYAGRSYSPGCCQNPRCEECYDLSRGTTGQRVPALPPRGLMVSSRSLNRDLNHAPSVARVVVLPVPSLRQCANVSSSHHPLPQDARANALYCDRACQQEAYRSRTAVRKS